MVCRITYHLNRIKLKTIIWLIFFLVFTFRTAGAQEFDAKLQIVFIYQITHYFQWPNDNSETFIIGVIGQSPILNELQKLAAAKKINNKTIIIKQFDNSSSISDCHILFIPYKESARIENIKKSIKGRHTMLISEKPGMAEKGTCINFVNIDGTMKFELNKSSCKSSGLRTTPMIEKLAIIIK